jgi:hypothetical protein
LTPLVALGDYRPTDAAEEVFEDLTERIEAELAGFDKLVADELPAFNAKVKKANLDAVIAG